MVDVRRGTPDDLERMWRIEQDAFEPARRSSKRSLARSIAAPSQRVFVADDGFLVGWCRDRTWRVYDLAVHPAAQGKGVGSALLAVFEAAAWRAGATRVVLEADRARPRLLAWYEAHGYAPYAIAPGHYGPGRDAVRFVKPRPDA